MLAHHVEAVEGLITGHHVPGVLDLEEGEVARGLEGPRLVPLVLVCESLDYRCNFKWFNKRQ